MSGKNYSLTPLEARKQLLLVESELNRVQLLNDVRVLQNEIQLVTNQVRAIGSFASSVAKMADTVSSIGHVFSHDEKGEHGKSSWISSLINGARTGASLWATFFPPREK
jgi:hypothetical protein